MGSIIRDVCDIDSASRAALEQLVGQRLRETQRVIIHVVNLDASASLRENEEQPEAPVEGGLPDWCNVYEGLSDEEIDDIERSIVRSSGSRSFG